MEKFKKTLRSFKSVIIFSILTVGLFFLAGCSGTLKSLRFKDSTAPNASNDSRPDHGSYITKSDNICSDGRIFLGTDANNRGDNIYVAGPSAIKEIHNPDQRYRIWYSGHQGSAWRIFHANSTDSDAWKKKNNEVPPEGVGGPFDVGSGEYGTDGRIPLSPDYYKDDIHVANPSVLRERKVECIGEVPGAPSEKPEYHAWYGGYDKESVAWRIFYAFSKDGLGWNKHLGKEVVNIRPNSKENIHVHNPSVVLDINKYCCSCPPQPPCCCEGNRIYHMWYSGYDGNAWRIFYATSLSGKVPWQKHGMVLDIGSSGDCDNLYVSEPTVVLEKKNIPACCGATCVEGSRIYHMWYAGYGGDPDNASCKAIGWRIFHATSIDGIHWQKDKKPALNLGYRSKGDNIYVAGPTVISDTPLSLCGEAGPPFLMWYAGYDGVSWVIYKAKSDNGIKWEKVNNSLP